MKKQKVKSLRRYAEVLEYRIVAGRRVLLPSELDLALKRLFVDELERALARFEREETPAEVLDLQERLKGSALAATEDNLRLGAWANWIEQRVLGRRSLQAQIEREQRALAQMLKLADEVGAVEIEREYYLLREFSLRERLAVEDEHSELNSDTGEVVLEKTQRNLALLQKVLGGYLEESEDLAGVTPAARSQALAGFAQDADAWAPAPSLDELSDTETSVLVDRMWSVNRLDPALVDYFR